MRSLLELRPTSLYLLAAVVILGIALPRVFSPACLEHSDTPFHFELARRHSLFDPNLFSHRYWPGGYPALVRVAALHLGIRPLYFGRALSAGASVVALVSCMRLAASCAWSLGAVVSALALLANPVFLAMASTEGTDMPATGLVMASIALLGAWRSRVALRPRDAAACGSVLGLAYLFRYTALVGTPVAFVALALGARMRARSIAAFVAGFLIASSPQLLSSAVVRGNPFYNELAINVWLGARESRETASVWRSAPAGISLVEAVSEDPARFATHWARDAGGWFLRGTGWAPGIVLFVIATTVGSAMSARIPVRRRILIVGCPLVAIGATALAFFAPRHGLVPICGLSVVLGVGVEEIRRRLQTRYPSALSSVACRVLAFGLAVYALGWSAYSYATRPTMRFVRTYHELMLDLGLQDVREVATNLEPMVDTDSHWLDRYQDLGGHYSASGVEELLTFPSMPEGISFVLLDLHAYWGDFKLVKRAVDLGGSRLSPISRAESLEVYMVRPRDLGGAVRDGVEFVPGLVLSGHTWVWRASRLVVYLYWTLRHPTKDRYRVEVRLLNQGRRLAQAMGEPELGTYPTSEWEEGKVVVDAHVIEIGEAASEGVVEVCLVREGDSRSTCERLWPVWRGGRTALP